MNKRLLWYLVVAFSALTILLSSNFNHAFNHKELGADKPKGDTVQLGVSTPGSNKEHRQTGPVSKVPWENNPDFRQAQENNQAWVQMASFCTVLPDPLPGEEHNVQLGARYLAGTVVKPGQVFSQNLTIGPYSQSRGFQKGPVYIGSQLRTTIGGGVCKLASTLYNVAVLSNLPIVERHAHSMPVPYVPYGQDATVNYGAKDFRFKNNTSFPILIWAQGIDNTLYIAFYGHSRPPQINWQHETLSRSPAPRIVRKNSSLPLGSERVVVQGMDGAVIKSWVNIVESDGNTFQKPMGNSYYRPMPYIIEKNLAAND